MADLLRWVFVEPLRTLFYHGPPWAGGLAGQRAADVCSALTGTPSPLWESQLAECEALLERQFWALATACVVGLYYGLWLALGLCLLRLGERGVERALWGPAREPRPRLGFSAEPREAKRLDET